MIKLDTTNMDRLRTSVPSKSGESQQRARSSASQQLQTVSLQYAGNERKSFTLFHRTVQRHLDQTMPGSLKEVQNKLADKALTDRETRADAAANNILGFIGHRLKLDAAEGASKEQLESRLNAAMEGFNSGYDEANEILSDLNLLTPELEQDISLTKQKVMAGLADFKEMYLSDSDTVVITPHEEEQKAYIPEPVPEKPALTRQELGKQLSSYSQVQMAQAREFSFNLETREGDSITIHAGALFALQAESGVVAQNAGSAQQTYQSSSGVSASQFAFSVEGDLNDEELAAINDVLNQVNDLAIDFYHGDVNRAFEKALEMGFDSSQISGFAFSMSQVQSVKTIQAYQPEQEILKPSVMAELKPIGRFASELSRSLALTDDAFSHPRELLSSLILQMQEIHQPPEFPSDRINLDTFAKGLIDKFSPPAITE